MSTSTSTILEELEQEAGTAAMPAPFRRHATRVGAIYTITYQRARVAIFDFDREKAGGLALWGFSCRGQEGR